MSRKKSAAALISGSILCIFFLIGPTTLPAQNDTFSSEAIITVDLIQGTIGGVDVRVRIENIIALVGKDRVLKETEYPEGEASDVYEILFGDHRVLKHWNATSFSDSVFRTSHGLGVGSILEDFLTMYGEGHFDESTHAYYFHSSDPYYQFACSGDFITGYDLNENPVIDKQQTVQEIWIW